MARSHAIDELPNFRAHRAANSLPFSIIQLRLRTRHAGVVGERRTVKTLIETWAGAAQTVITAADQRVSRQKHLFKRGKVDRNLNLSPGFDVFQFCALRQLIIVSNRKPSALVNIDAIDLTLQQCTIAIGTFYS